MRIADFKELEQQGRPGEFTLAPPCLRRVHQRGTDELLGWCTRHVGHRGGCTPLVDDRLTHNLRA